MSNLRFSAACLLALTTSAPAFSSYINNNNYGALDSVTGTVAERPASPDSVQLAQGNDELKSPMKEYDGELSVKLPEAPWPELQIQLTQLIEKTIADPTYENREFIFNVLGEDYEAFHGWKKTISRKLQYPISIGILTLDRGEKKPCGFHDQKKKITIRSYTLKEQRSRQMEADLCEFYSKHKSSNSKAYNFLVSKLDHKKINHGTFHNLLVRANLGPEELYKGVHDASEQTPIDVLPITLLKTNLDEAVLEFQSLIRKSLKESMKQFVLMVFNLDPKASFNVASLFSHHDVVAMKRRNPDFDLCSRAATIVQSEENRIYLLFHNSERSTLDLHGLTPKEAKEKLISFIYDKYETFQTHFHVMTGQGLTADSIGLLKKELPKWLVKLDEINNLIESWSFNAKNPGICDIVLYPPLTLFNDPENEIPDDLKRMMMRGTVSAVRPHLYEPDAFIFLPQYGHDDKPIEIKEKVTVRLENDEHYLPRAPMAKKAPAKKGGAKPKNNAQQIPKAAAQQKVRAKAAAELEKSKAIPAKNQVQPKAPAKQAQQKAASANKQEQPKVGPAKQAQPNAVSKQAQPKAAAVKKKGQPKVAPAKKVQPNTGTQQARPKAPVVQKKAQPKASPAAKKQGTKKPGAQKQQAQGNKSKGK